MPPKTESEMAERRTRYLEAVPEDRDNQVAKLLQTYSHIPADKVTPHLHAIRDRAWAVFPYTCIGSWRFLDLYFTKLPVYASVVERLRDGGDRLLDAGCCFGYMLRQLAADGAPTANLVGSDLEQLFIDLGFDLFRDRDTFKGTFVAADMLEDDEAGAGQKELTALDGTLDVVHAASFFHIFSWEDQVRLGERVVRFFRPADKTKATNSGQPRLLFGRQVGNIAPVDRATLAARGEYRFHHNPATLQQLWDEIGERTKTKWRVEAELVPEARPEKRQPATDGAKKKEDHYMIRFAIYQEE
ncbi:hypothetical protein SPBR_07674 [Sporothrix brasiliensis 5110]|uniref:Methyltransferase domain-containing protein n=1 Tax=Sporothrix brasiliensis 5110 TaxID=1398154 RepID=A0A0C2IQP6_9PEZI|nr:uncharacterized protein SPBR_07674 [Sporothrix brasiliensis 5110]KIH89205.1 hypothetical protein SPBR_07674 [Sporothrix brasiliensis 5110]